MMNPTCRPFSMRRPAAGGGSGIWDRVRGGPSSLTPANPGERKCATSERDVPGHAPRIAVARFADAIRSSEFSPDNAGSVEKTDA